MDLRRYVTCVGVDIQDDRRSGKFEGDHFHLSAWRNDFTETMENCTLGECRYGFRGVRVGESSHPGLPSLRRLRSGRNGVVRVDISVEGPLVRHVHKHVVPRIAGVASVVDGTQIDVEDVEGHSTVAPTMLDSLAKDISEAIHTPIFETLVALVVSFFRNVDEFSSASSESCRRERGGDEEVEWGALLPPSGQADDRVSFREGNHDRPRVRRLHLTSSQSVCRTSIIFTAKGLQPTQFRVKFLRPSGRGAQRHAKAAHRVALDWLFDRIYLEFKSNASTPKINSQTF